MATTPTSSTHTQQVAGSGQNIQSIGIVKSTSGEVTAINASGATCKLQPGDKVFPNDVIQTDELGSVQIEFLDGQIAGLGRLTSLLLDKNVFDHDQFMAKTDDLKSIEDQIAAGADPTQVTPASAAGADPIQGSHPLAPETTSSVTQPNESISTFTPRGDYISSVVPRGEIKTGFETNQASSPQTLNAPSVPAAVAHIPISKLTVNVDSITNHSKPTVTGSTDVGSTITVTASTNGNAAITLGTATADNNGNFTVTTVNPLVENTYTITVTARNATGDTLTVAAPNTVTIDTTAPNAPTVIVDNVTNDTTPTVSGTAEAGTTVTVTATQGNATITLGTTTVAANGTFAVTSATPLGDGTYTIKATATDAAGNSATATAQNTISIDTIAPNVPTVIVDNVTNDTTPTVSGTADAGATVTVTATQGNAIITLGTTTVAANGTFAVTSATPLGDGTYTIKATATDAAGNSATATAQNTISIDTTATVSLSATNSIAEGGSIVYTASLDAKAQGDVTVTLSNGKSITIADGQSSGTVSVVPGDDVYRDAGNVSATITGATGGNFESLAVNPAPATTAVTDTTATASITIDAISADNVINAAEAGGSVAANHWVDGTPDWKVVTRSDGSTVQGDLGNSYLAANLTAPTGAAAVEVTYNGSMAGYHNPVGWFTIDGNGKPGNLQMLWNDVKDISTGTTKTLGVGAGEKLGFFLVADQATWFEQTYNASTMTMKLGADNVIRVYNNGNLNSEPIKSFSADKVMSTLSAGNDNAWDVASGKMNGKLYIGFDDQPGGDNDFNDVYISVGYKSADTIAVTGTVGGDAKAGDTVTLNVNDTPYTGSVVADTTGKLGYSIDVKGSDLAADANHTVDAKVSVTDAAGNTFIASASHVYTVTDHRTVSSDDGGGTLEESDNGKWNYTSDNDHSEHGIDRNAIKGNDSDSSPSKDNEDGERKSNEGGDKDKDTLRGTDNHNDILVGGKGDDILSGGLGSDTFQYGKNDLTNVKNGDTISDFKVAKVDANGDVLDIHDLLGKGGTLNFDSVKHEGDKTTVKLSIGSGDCDHTAVPLATITMSGLAPNATASDILKTLLENHELKL